MVVVRPGPDARATTGSNVMVAGRASPALAIAAVLALAARAHADQSGVDSRVAHWAAVLTGDSAIAAPYWANGTVPPLLAERFAGGKIMPGNRTWRGTCPGKLLRPGPQASAPVCHDYWPRPREAEHTGCVAVSVGIGDEWSFEDMASGNVPGTPRQPPVGCRVHAFDATRNLRAESLMLCFIY